MVQAATSLESWQHLYRALLRSSAASVRFNRPAARNTRRYLRDEFAGAIIGKDSCRAESGIDSSTVHGGSRDTTPSGSTSSSSPTSSISSTSIRHKHLGEGARVETPLGRQARNTLAFHLSASLLSNGPTEHTRVFKDRALPASTLLPSTTSSDALHATIPLGPARQSPAGPTRSSDRDDDRTSHPPTDHASAAQPTKRPRVAHRVISNLASLTYHHLSPYTQMQSRAHLKSNRALRKPKKLSSLARVLGKIEAAEIPLDDSLRSTDPGLEDVLSPNCGSSNRATEREGDETLVNAAHMKLGFLIPTVKPVRGPLSARLKEWDGQDTSKMASEGNLRQMEADLETIERLLMEHSNSKGGNRTAMSKQVQQLKAEAEQLRKNIKSTARKIAQADAQKEMDDIPIQHLADLVAAAQDSEDILLGKSRWIKRKDGDFLPP